MIENLSFDSNQQLIYWEYNGEKIVFLCEHFHTALPTQNYGVFILKGKNISQNSLLRLSPNGKIIYEIRPPKGWVFLHLLKHPLSEIALLCQSDKGDANGRCDWHFSVNPENGVLHKLCPSY